MLIVGRFWLFVPFGIIFTSSNQNNNQQGSNNLHMHRLEITTHDVNKKASLKREAFVY